MELRHFLVVFLVSFLTAASAGAQQTEGTKPRETLSLPALLIEVSKNVEDFAENLPDLVCTERLDQNLFDARGNLLSAVSYESRLTGRQTKEQTPRGVQFSFRESRDVRTIDGKKPQQPGARVTGAQVGGLFSSILISHFGFRDRHDFIWILKQAPNPQRSSYVLEFQSDPARPHQYYEFEGKQILSRQRGEAWIDAESLQVERLAFSELNLPQDVAAMSYEVRYSPVKLGGEVYWLPSFARSEMRDRKDASRSTAEHRLFDYHKYSGEIKIVNE